MVDIIIQRPHAKQNIILVAVIWRFPHGYTIHASHENYNQNPPLAVMVKTPIIKKKKLVLQILPTKIKPMIL